ncbi:hypothetical protein NI389_05715 [Pseudoalteromonas xiamenensis]|uniref:hypothetical protein n=1 Tax=Pseudoalteromonas xiamenensis TaxID=882626 RepID=UPI0027E56948|nr:hypothetical protein [Pseudoalteromonas xiamenensis]WMN60905.1 hypothetical protein NI389_05715 [Pseudoalteromonas xiamenensis]
MSNKSVLYTILVERWGSDLALCSLFSKPADTTRPPSITPENKQLMSNASAWMRCKADLVLGWAIQPFTFISIDYLKIKRDLGVTSNRCEGSQHEEVEAWMPTGGCFMDEFLNVIKLNCTPSLVAVANATKSKIED